MKEEKRMVEETPFTSSCLRLLELEIAAIALKAID